MKKFTVFLLFMTIFLLLPACSVNETSEKEEYIVEENYEDFIHCETCNDSVEDESYVETDSDSVLCISCAFKNSYIKCKGCNSYFINDITLDATAYYCSSCAYDYASGCCFCGSGPLDYDKLVKFSVDNESYYMCVDCCADYFVNIEPMNPCYYCIECGEIFDGKPYPHYIYNDTVICKDCIIKDGFLRCKLCKKYYDEGENDICGYCNEQVN